MPTKTVLETLEAARKLISDPAKWTKSAYARALSGRPLSSANDSEAVCWCAQGAIRKVYGKESDLLPAIEALKMGVPGRPVDWAFVGYNDTHTHAEVLAAFDAAIAKEKEKVTR